MFHGDGRQLRHIINGILLIYQQNIFAMKRILVPCDFSNPAVNAYRFALNIAAQTRGTVHLLHVIELPVVYDPLLMPVLNFEEELLKDLKEAAEVRFKGITDKYKAEQANVVVKTQFGPVSHVLEDYIIKESIDLVVMGSHGASGARELFIGSNAARMVRTSSVPVLIVKGYYKGPIRNIVFPNTFETEDLEDLVMRVKALQNFFKAHLHLVWINTPLNFATDTNTTEKLQLFAKRFLLKDYTINVFSYTNEEGGIVEFSKRVKGDLIALGTHGRKGIAHLIHGSLAEDIVNHTSGLVWTYALKKQPVED